MRTLRRALHPLWIAAVLAAILSMPARGQAYRIEAVTTPFSYRAVWKSAVVEELAADTAHTALFYITDRAAGYLESPLRFDSSATRIDAVYRTSDDRRARLTITPRDDGYRLELSFCPDSGIIGVGEMLRARFDEEFTAVPGDSVVSDAGGRFFRILRTDSTRMPPFYWSSAGYALVLNDFGNGYLDLGSRVADIIRLYTRGHRLTYTVVFGNLADAHRATGTLDSSGILRDRTR